MRATAGRWLVTGASGFIGSHLLRRGLAQGLEVHALVRPGTDGWRCADLRASIAWHEADVLDRAALDAAWSASKPDVVFHAAMWGDHPSTAGARRQQLLTSTLGTMHVLDASAAHDARVVHLGSGLEYGSGAALPETTAPEPETFRGAAKLAASMLCVAAARQHGQRVTVLRIFSVYGPWEPRHRLVPTAIRAAERGEPMPLASTGRVADLVFVDDVVDACVAASRSERALGRVLNVGTGIGTTTGGVVAAVEQATGRSIRGSGVAHGGSATDRIRLTADTSAAADALGWRARTDLQAGLARSVAWYREHPDAW